MKQKIQKKEKIHQYGGPNLCPPGAGIDLSLPSSVYDKIFVGGRSVRTAIRDYRHQVRRKMFQQEHGTVTPWGIWNPSPRKGLYEMRSTLDNRFIDTELAAPFLPSIIYKAVYPRMENGGGILMHESLPMRHTVRGMARSHLYRLVTQRTAGPNSSFMKKPILRVNLVSPKALQDLASLNGIASRELGYACNQHSLIANRLLLADGLAGDIAKAHGKAKGGRLLHSGALSIELSANEIIPPELPRYAPATQSIFIDLKTLAMLSTNFVDGQKNYERAWLWWSALCGLSGIPSAVLTPHGKMDPKHPLSPCNMRFDPIFAVVYGMWALGCCSRFSVTLALNHPVRGSRGVYMTFQLGGDARKLLMDIESGMASSSTTGQLSAPNDASRRFRDGEEPATPEPEPESESEAVTEFERALNVATNEYAGRDESE